MAEKKAIEDNVKAEKKEKEKIMKLNQLAEYKPRKPPKYDFLGQEYTEVYDD